MIPWRNPDVKPENRNPDVAEAALAYARAGIPVFPCDPKTKAPLTASGFKDASTNPATIADWWKRNRNAAIGLPTGGIVALDCDGKHRKNLVAEFETRCRELGVDWLNTLPKQTTPNGGGAHYLFRTSDEIRNRRLSRNADGETTIETRGAGGYILAAPSPGYRMTRGAMASIPAITAEQMAALFEVAHSFNEKPEREAATPSMIRSDRSGQGLSPGDDYGARGDVFTLLRSHGWTEIRQGYWRRPGKESGISATWDKCPGKLYCFSSNATPLEPETSYSPFALYATFEHNGDFSAAARALVQSGYGNQEIVELTNEPDPPKTETRTGGFTELGPILDGDLEPELPTLGEIEGGKCLFYSGRLNEIHGEPSVGKTNINLAFCARELNRGATVVYIDPEDTPRGILLRLLSFGAEREAIRERFKYLHNPEPVDILWAVGWTRKNLPAVVIADGLAELLAAQGLSEDKPGDILPFYRKFLRPFADAGAAVVISDHVVKDSETRGLWPRGSGGKMGRYDGGVYLARLIESYGPEKPGAVKLTVAKDRNGGVGPKGFTACEIHFTPGEGEGTHVAFKQADGRGFVPTVLMGKVCRAIESDPNISKRGLRALGKSQAVEQAINLLVAEGTIRIEKGGTGKSDRFILVERRIA